MPRKVAILQSNYIPWKGHFDLMNKVDDFVIYDCVQYTKNDWRNRNQIKSKNVMHWLTIPVSVKSSAQLINERVVANNLWAEKHLKTLTQTYAKARFFSEYADELRECYELVKSATNISEINLIFIRWINSRLGIDTRLHLTTGFVLDLSH
jgi:hypothetical protein